MVTDVTAPRSGFDRYFEITERGSTPGREIRGGFVDAGFVRRVPDAAGTPVPVGLGIGGKLVTWPGLVFVLGLLLTLVLVVRRVRGAILGGGLIAYVVVKLARGKAREVPPLLYAVAALFVVYFLRGPLESVLT